MDEKRKKLRVNEITVDPAVAVRERTDEDVIERYAENLEDFPPIVVFQTDDKYLLADGFHRRAAAVRRGWEYLPAKIVRGSKEEASEFAITSNLRHGKPLTAVEYGIALRRLVDLHPNWTQKELAETLSRSQQWVSVVLAANDVGESLPESKLDMRIKSEISRAPRELWREIGRVAEEQGWTCAVTQEKVKAIRQKPERAQEIIQPFRIEVPEAPADKLIPLTKEIKRVCEMEDKFGEKLDPSLYDWGSGALAAHVLQGLYVLADKTVKRMEKMGRMIEYLEERGKR